MKRRLSGLLISVMIIAFLMTSCITIFLPEPKILGPADGSKVTGSSIHLTWENQGGGVVYDLLIGTNRQQLNTVAQGLTQTQYTYSGIQPGTTYFWRVVSRKDMAVSTSSIYSFQVLGYQYFGVLYGASDYSGTGWSNLPLTAHDANDLDFALKELQPAYTIQQKRVGQVTRTQIVADLAAAITQTPEGAVFLFFYAGHGGRQGSESYLALTDGQRLYVTDLREKLDLIPGPKIVIIDACNSGSFTDLLPGLTPSQREALIQREMESFNNDVIQAFANPEGQEGLIGRNNYYVLTAASLAQSSWESSVLQNGVFSFFLLDGIGDVGIENPLEDFDYTYDADANNDGVITLQELYDYIKPRARQFLIDQGGTPQDAQISPAGSDFPVAIY